MSARLNWLLNTATDCIVNGGVIAYPTETIYGLGCDPLNPLAVHRLLDLKQRSVHKGLILIASDINQLRYFIQPLTKAQQVRISRKSTRPTTWLVPARKDVPNWLTGNHTSLAVRITRHPLAKALCQRLNSPLVSTSANCSGQPAARNALQVRQRFNSALANAKPDMIIHGHCGTNNKTNNGTDNRSSIIRDLRSNKILRS